MDGKERLFSEQKLDLKDLMPMRTNHLFCHVHFLPISLTTCVMEGGRTSCLQRQEIEFCSLFFRKKGPPHSEKSPLHFSSSFVLENPLILLQWDNSSVGHAWLSWILSENHCLQPPVGCRFLLWTFGSLRIGPYFRICAALSTFCPGGSVELTHTTQNKWIFWNIAIAPVINRQANKSPPG